MSKANELARLKQMLIYEKEGRQWGYQFIAGIDEAGRGPLAGPVVAAACILPIGLVLPGINDSKLLTPSFRKTLFHELVSHPQLIFGVGKAESEEIDQVNIYQATLLAMRRALDALTVRPDYLLVDGMPLSYQEIPFLKIIKGDQLSQSIAAASIIAKETRDAMMDDYHEEWPHYGFNRHRGYGTELHFNAIKAHGPCRIHRRSFEPIKSIK